MIRWLKISLGKENEGAIPVFVWTNGDMSLKPIFMSHFMPVFSIDD